MTLLRAMDPEYSTDEAIIQAFLETKEIKVTEANRAALEGNYRRRRRHRSGDRRSLPRIGRS